MAALEDGSLSSLTPTRSALGSLPPGGGASGWKGGNQEDQCLCIGVWCDYGVTLAPTEGIGVFVYNLVAGLLRLDEPVEVVMVVRPGDRHIPAGLAALAPGRLRIIPEESRPSAWERWAQRSQALRWAARRMATLLGPKACCQRMSQIWRDARGGQQAPRRALHVLGTAGVLMLTLVLLIGSVLAGPVLVMLYRAARAVYRRRQEESLDAIVHAAGCDVWLIPYAGFAQPLTFPAVVVVHDFVIAHFPEMWDQQTRAAIEATFRARSAEARLCACMAEFIRDVDLVGVLGVPRDKVRVVRPAPPSDFLPTTGADASRLRALGFCRPYVLYPAAFRPYKNHRILVEALAQMRDRHGEAGVDLVFTGIREAPAELRALIDERSLGERVHVLGCVDRETLATLYRGALATVVPTLYEQGSFPVYEALHWGCPVACSDIPPLREQCAAMGDAMVYFEPNDAAAVSRTILTLRDERETIRARQQAAARRLWQRTWTDAARDWLAVFREAARLAPAGNASPDHDLAA